MPLYMLAVVLVVSGVMHYLTIATNPANTVPRALGVVGTPGVYLATAGWLLVSSF